MLTTQDFKFHSYFAPKVTKFPSFFKFSCIFGLDKRPTVDHWPGRKSMFRLFGQTATWPQYNQQGMDQSYSVFIARKVWFFNWCFLCVRSHSQAVDHWQTRRTGRVTPLSLRLTCIRWQEQIESNRRARILSAVWYVTCLKSFSLLYTDLIKARIEDFSSCAVLNWISIFLVYRFLMSCISL